MNRFCKLDDGSWGLSCEEVYARGEECLVERKDGSSDTVMVGEYIGTNRFGDHLHRIWNQGNDRAKGAPRAVPKAAPSKPESKPMADDEVPF